MRATTEEREAVASLPQVRLFSLNAFREWAQEQRHHSLLGFLSLLVEQNFRCTTPSDGKESFSIFIEWIFLDQHWCDTVFSMRYQWNCSSFDSSLSLILLSFATKFVFVHNFVFFPLCFVFLVLYDSSPTVSWVIWFQIIKFLTIFCSTVTNLHINFMVQSLMICTDWCEILALYIRYFLRYSFWKISSTHTQISKTIEHKNLKFSLASLLPSKWIRIHNLAHNTFSFKNKFVDWLVKMWKIIQIFQCCKAFLQSLIFDDTLKKNFTLEKTPSDSFSGVFYNTIK